MIDTKLITVRVEESGAGLFIATSAEEEGFFLSTTSALQMRAAIPAALEDYFRSRREDVVVLAVEGDEWSETRWAVAPKALVVQRLERASFHKQT